jgi:branched-subunit amino acid ABC-type transport system permease component
LAVGFFLGKANVDLIALLAIQVLYAIASLALISVGLAIIFGMMRVINIAHGEFLMLGGYAAIVATSHDRVAPSRWNLQDARLL